jgi:hypothetical protein
MDALRRDLSDLAALLALQKLLIKEIMHAESKIPALRNILKTSQADASLERRLEAIRYAAYIWRCFGDAIAFLYLDKHALKHTFYHADKLTAKQSAGFLAKDGMVEEFALVERAISEGFPALLTDLTNTIRHGDVCLMGEADPDLIEVKSSSNLNPRGKRQQRNIEILKSFFATDASRQLRGLRFVHRVASPNSERTYASEMGSCIQDALQTGCGVRTPEPGLHYIAVAKQSAVKKALRKIDLSSKSVFLLNDFKSQKSWAPYYPFTLSIKDIEHLWAFILGSVTLMVAVDYSVIATALNDAGHKAVIDVGSADYPVRFVLKSGELGAIGQILLNRVGLEFLSPSTMALSSAEILQASTALLQRRHEQGEDMGDIRSMPDPEAWLRGEVP